MSRINQQFTAEESALHSAFSHGGTSCSVTCDCGRIYFCTAPGHGDYETGELESLLARSREPDSLVIECPEFSGLGELHLLGGTFVIQCECGKGQRFIKWLEDHTEQLVKYLTRRLEQKKDEQARELATTTTMSQDLAGHTPHHKYPPGTPDGNIRGFEPK